MGENEYRIIDDELCGYLPDGTEMRRIVCFGNSAWAKPSTAPNGAALGSGSVAVETDTQKAVFYDEINGWGQ